MRESRPTFVSLFTGAGGFDLGLERAGFRCVSQVEIDPFCQRVLAVRWPDVPRWSDVRSVGVRSDDELGSSPIERDESAAEDRQRAGVDRLGTGHLDLLVAGFPCQDLSVAGKRAGLSGQRSGLFWEIVRIAKELTPTWGLFENVPGLLSSAGGADMGLVLAGLRECWPAVGYRVLDSRYFGVAQRRRRVFFVCGPDEARVAQVLFESAGGGGDLAAGREAGTRVTASLDDGADAACFNLRGRDEGARLEMSDKASLRAASGGSSRSYVATGTNAQRYEVAPPFGSSTGGQHLERPYVIHTLKAEGHDASEDGTGRGTLIVAQPLTTRRGGPGGDCTANGAVVTPFDTTQITSDKNYSNSKPGDPCHPRAAGAHPPAVILPYAVRRLTPVETERLQNFPDGWTCLCQPLEAWVDAEFAADACTCPDSPRYRAMGNAVTVSVVFWLGRRLMTAMRASETPTVLA